MLNYTKVCTLMVAKQADICSCVDVELTPCEWSVLGLPNYWGLVTQSISSRSKQGGGRRTFHSRPEGDLQEDDAS